MPGDFEVLCLGSEVRSCAVFVSSYVILQVSISGELTAGTY